MDAITESPRVFISYSWDTKESDAWVKKLATDLRNNGIDATLDKWKLVPGDRMLLFMETSIRENNYVVIICTPKYKLKSENRLGGVGYEGDIMTAEVLQNSDPRKFIPIIQSGNRHNAIPGWLNGKYSLDFTDSLNYESDLENLIRTVLHILEPELPLASIPEKYQREIKAIERKQEQNAEENIPIETTITPANSLGNTARSQVAPFIEADLILHHSSRSPRGYSSKNPTETDEGGNLITVIGAGVKPIIFWELGWRFDLVLHNNSSYPAYNIKLESIGDASFSFLENLDTINNLRPFDNIKLKAEFRQHIEDVHTVADEIMAHKIPQNLEKLILQITYFSEDRSNKHQTLFKIENNKVINVGE